MKWILLLVHVKVVDVLLFVKPYDISTSSKAVKEGNEDMFHIADDATKVVSEESVTAQKPS